MNEHDDIGRELHAMRAEPRPEFARELDERAAGWLRARPRWRLPSPRVAIPAATAATAAAAVVIALAVSGGNGDGGGDGAALEASGGSGGGAAALQVAVVPDQGAVEELGGARAAPQAAPQDSTAAAEGGFSAARATRVEQGRPVTLRYFFTAPAEATVELAGREATVTVGPGAGRIKISTEGLPSGKHRLVIATPPAPLYREQIEIGG